MVCGSGRKTKKKKIAVHYNREEGSNEKQYHINRHGHSNQLGYCFERPYESKCKG